MTAAIKSPSVVETRDQIALHFGVHLRTVGTWMAAGCPGQPGAYDLDAVAAWRSDNAKRDQARLHGPPMVPPAIRRIRARGFFFTFNKKTGLIAAKHPDGREHVLATLERSEVVPRPALGRAVVDFLNEPRNFQ